MPPPVIGVVTVPVKVGLAAGAAPRVVRSERAAMEGAPVPVVFLSNPVARLDTVTPFQPMIWVLEAVPLRSLKAGCTKLGVAVPPELLPRKL